MAFGSGSRNPSCGGLSFGRLAAGALVAVLCLAFSGCDVTEKTRSVIDQRANEAQQSLDSTHKIDHPVAYDPLTVSSKVWGGSTALRMQRGMPLPARYETPRGVTLVSSDPMSLNDIANAISAQTGIPLRLIALTAAGKSSSSSPASPSSPGIPNPSGMPGASSSNSSSASAGTGNLEMPVSYEGPLSGLLDRISAYFGVNWRYDGSAISVSRFETRIFVIEALPGTQEVNEGMQDDSANGSSTSSSSSSSGSSAGGSVPAQNTSTTLTQNSKTTVDLKYWDELNQVLNSIVGGQGSVVVSPTMGTATITTTPDVMETVSDYLNKENKRLSREIAINVQIYSVNLGQSEDFTLAFTSFLDNLSKIARLSYTTAAAPGITNSALSASSFGQLSIAILNGPNGAAGTGPASDVFNALSSIGDATTVAQFPMTTLNNHPVSRRVGTDTAYIQSYTQNTTTATSTTTVLTPVISSLHDGFSLQLTPRLLDDGRILLQYSLSLVGVDSTPSTNIAGLGPVTLPVTDNRIFVQQSMLRSGSTLIIGGVDQEKLYQNKQGVGSPDNFLLGGGTSTDNSHFMMFMAITPQVMDVGGDHG